MFQYNIISVSFCPISLGQNETLTCGRFSFINATIFPKEHFFCTELVNWTLLNMLMLKKVFKYIS